MHALLIRTLSSLIAIISFVAIYLLWEIKGLKGLCIFAVVLGTREMFKIMFREEKASFFVKMAFYVMILSLFLLSVNFPKWSGLFLSLYVTFYFIFTLLRHSKFNTLKNLLWFQTNGILAFLYLGLFPSFIWMLIDLPKGLWWFAFLLTVTFTNDIFAYAFGLIWGNKKIFPEISPKKTIVGSLGGILGALLAAFLLSYKLNHIHFLDLMILGFFVGIFAQSGDFFESLLKRIANIKDSGRLMPGHGGLLDRLDGVLFAAPVTLLGALFLEKILFN